MIKRIKEFIKWYLNPYYWIKPYFVSFIEEGIFNPDYFDYVGGRVEVWTHWSQYDIDEYRFLTKDQEGFYKFREKYDFKDVSRKTLKKIEKIVGDKFHDKVK